MKTIAKVICQSCGMPLTEEADFGTQKDGSQHPEYCHYCYQNGEFTDAGISMEEKIKKNIAIAVDMGMPEAKAKALAFETIPKLKRWQ